MDILRGVFAALIFGAIYMTIAGMIIVIMIRLITRYTPREGNLKRKTLGQFFVILIGTSLAGIVTFGMIMHWLYLSSPPEGRKFLIEYLGQLVQDPVMHLKAYFELVPIGDLFGIVLMAILTGLLMIGFLLAIGRFSGVLPKKTESEEDNQ